MKTKTKLTKNKKMEVEKKVLRKIINSLNEKFDNFYEKLEFKSELKRRDKNLKKICRKYKINSNLEEMYLRIQKNILEEINKKILEKKNKKKTNTKQEKRSEYLYVDSVLKRIYELNKEFLTLILLKFYHSSNMLTRQIIEIYIQILYCRYNPNYKRVLMETPEKFSYILDKVNQLKKANIDLPYICVVNKEEFLDNVYSDFSFFSDKLHPSSFSFAENIWIYNKKENKTRLYIEKPILINGEMLIFFPKESIIPLETFRRIIDTFFTYSGLILEEICLVDKNENQN